VANCETNIADDVPAFYKKYFRCVDISMKGSDVLISSKDLPPHVSGYYPESDPNYVTFDTSTGQQKLPGTTTIEAQNASITIPSNPMAKGLTIDGSLIDQTAMTSQEEFPSAAAAGMALNSVAFFKGTAAMGMVVSDEAETFDRYEGHHARCVYHYNGQSPGPLEVLQHAGIISNTTPGSASVELYAIMCDGTVVLGCTELDGSKDLSAGGALDAQGGHVHDISDGTTVHFTQRYHTHVCPGSAGSFSPEIQYHTVCP